MPRPKTTSLKGLALISRRYNRVPAQQNVGQRFTSVAAAHLPIYFLTSDFKGSVLRKNQRLNQNGGVATVDQKARRRIPRRADARLRIRLLVGLAGEVPSHLRPKSYLRRQRSYSACDAIQSQNILTTTMASSTATAAKVVPESLVTPFRATLEHSAKLLAGSFIITKNPNLPHVISAFRWDIYARRLDRSAATLPMPLR